MRSPVVVASTWSASRAEVLAAHLRNQGIDSFTKTNLDRTTYGGEIGGAAVFVDVDQRLEAELELVLLADSRPVFDDPTFTDVASSDGGEDAGTTRPSRTWVRVGSWVALAALVVGTVAPSVMIVWSRIGG